MKKIIILNGPPYSGKDTSADYLVEKHGYTKLEMKGALRALAHKIASLTSADPVALCNRLEFTRELKDTEVVPEFGNRTWPQFLIWLSEDVCKPIFGQDVFARAAIVAINNANSDKIVFSDGGFPIEARAIYEAFPHDLLLVAQVHREGRSFSVGRKDSRQYIRHPENNEYWHLDNNAGLVQLKLELEVLAKSIDNTVSND